MDNSPFAKLSPEMRNIIYALVVHSDCPLKVGPLDNIFVDGWGAVPGVQPAITRVCKQSRSESLLLFYASNTFMVPIPDGEEIAFDFEMDAGESDISDWIRVFDHAFSAATKWFERTHRSCHAAIPRLSLQIGVFYDDWDT